MKSITQSSSFFANVQQAYQDWVRRHIIDDDPYDALTRKHLEENTMQINEVESAELV